jgi:hypothetical protein
MHKGCKGCRDEKSLCFKQHIKPICPCTTCLIKPMCTVSCEILRTFVEKNLEELKMVNKNHKR